ncbi:MAG: hypothetical protein QM530_03525 [Phycisphaerales bacterium]|nr:hypothetical protein [Phycisphaerales bacterium]
MKKITTFLFAVVISVAALQFASCKKDNKSSNPTIIGTWASKTFNVKEVLNGVVLTDTTESYTDTEEVTFNTDNSYNYVDVKDTTYNENGTYSIAGTKLYITRASGWKDTFDYEVSSSEFTIKRSYTYTDVDGNHVHSRSIKYAKK